MTLRVGLVGAGPWARVHARHLASHRATTLAGIWARRPEAATELATPLSAPVIDSFEDLLAVCDAVDLVVPPQAQVDFAVRAASAGRHLLLEKPLSLDVEGACRVAGAVRASGVTSQLMLTRRFHPLTEAWLRRVEDEVREVDGVSAHYVHGAFLGGEFATAWRLQEGVLMDLGPHLLDLMEQAAGRIVTVSVRRNEADAVAVMTQHETGALGQAILSGRSAGPSTQRLWAFGTRGKAEFDASAVDEATVFKRALDTFVGAAEQGRPAPIDAERGLELQLLLAACRESLLGAQTVGVAAKPTACDAQPSTKESRT